MMALTMDGDNARAVEVYGARRIEKKRDSVRDEEGEGEYK